MKKFFIVSFVLIDALAVPILVGALGIYTETEWVMAFLPGILYGYFLIFLLRTATNLSGRGYTSVAKSGCDAAVANALAWCFMDDPTSYAEPASVVSTFVGIVIYVYAGELINRFTSGSTAVA